MWKLRSRGSEHYCVNILWFSLFLFCLLPLESMATCSAPKLLHVSIVTTVSPFFRLCSSAIGVVASPRFIGWVWQTGETDSFHHIHVCRLSCFTTNELDLKMCLQSLQLQSPKQIWNCWILWMKFEFTAPYVTSKHHPEWIENKFRNHLET